MNVFSRDIIQALSIDCVLIGFEKGQLEILLVQHAEGISKGRWALPGGWIRYNESLDDAANRILKDLTGIEHLYLEQLQAFGGLNRYPAQRVITIAYFALVKPEDYHLIPGFTAADARWFSWKEVPELPYDHNQILEFSLQRLRYQVRHEPIGFNLLPEKFTLLQLQALYEAVLGTELDKPNFRRKIKKMNLLVPCSEKGTGVSHRAARLYRFDEKVYRELIEEGFSFKL